MTVQLSNSEIMICNLIGSMRSLIARTANIKDAKMGKQNGIDSDVMGMTAEYAFAKHFNLFPDLGLSPRSGSFDGILNGYRYDIKSTDYKNGRLLSTMKVNPDIDMYVLAIVTDDLIDFKGYALKKDLIKDENIKNLGHGDGYCLDQSQLKKFK